MIKGMDAILGDDPPPTGRQIELLKELVGDQESARILAKNPTRSQVAVIIKDLIQLHELAKLEGKIRRRVVRDIMNDVPSHCNGWGDDW